MNVQYKTTKISPLQQAGTWQLEDYLVVVGKSGLWGTKGFWPVEIVQMQPYGVVHAAQMNELTACYAALQALVNFFGNGSEVREFAKHYPCSDDVEHLKTRKGLKMTDDLEGDPTQQVPAWIRRSL